MASIQTRLFRRTVSNVADPSLALEEAASSLQDEVNAFIAPMNPQDVLEIQTGVDAVGKYGVFTHYWMQVHYYIP